MRYHGYVPFVVLCYTTLCDKVCQWLAPGQWFSPASPVSSTNKIDRHDLTEILKMVLNTITKTSACCQILSFPCSWLVIEYHTYRLVFNIITCNSNMTGVTIKARYSYLSRGHEHHDVILVFSGVRFAQFFSFLSCGQLCHFIFLFPSLYCVSFDIRLPNIPLVSSYFYFDWYHKLFRIKRYILIL